MQQQYEPAYQGARALLLEAERHRHDMRRCHLFWNATLWEDCFNACIAEDQRRDESIQQQIAASASGDAQQRRWIQSLYNAIDSDIAWYHDLLNDLQATRQRWETDASVKQRRVDELLMHENMVEYRLHERQAELQQLSIEYLEQRRLVEGGLEPGVWAQHWSYLQRAWYAQDLFYHRVYGLEIPRTIRASRLAWCQHIGVFHQTIAKTWGYKRSFDWRELKANSRLLQAEIDKYRPRFRQLVRWRRTLMIASVIGVLGVFLWFRGTDVSSGQLRREQGKPGPVPTASSLGGIFLQQPTIPPEPSASHPPIPTTTPGTGVSGQVQSEYWNDQGLTLMIKGHCRDAIGSFQAAIEADPSFYEPPNNLAFCLFENGDLEGAIAQWQQSIHLKRDNADGYAGLGMALHASGQPEAGLMNYRHALQINAQYGNESWLRTTAFWSERAINASAPLRADLR